MTEYTDITVSTTVVVIVLITLHVTKLLDIVIWGVTRDTLTVTVGKVDLLKNNIYISTSK